MGDGEEDGVIEAPEGSTFVYATSKRAVSFILGKENWYEDNETPLDDATWPRTSQFIMLDSQADLLGGLLDFDLSVVACSYDGVSVRVAPRAAISLMTKLCFITPFCFEEHRNKRRVIKYAQRGFKPLLVDPHDNRPIQNVAWDARITRQPFLPKSINYSGHISYDVKDEIARIQEDKMRESNRVFCCHVFGGRNVAFSPLGSDTQKLNRSTHVPYTQMMFEKVPGDAIDFFKQQFNWSDSDLRRVEEVDPYLRMACKKCKIEYNLVRVIMPRYPNLMKEYNLEDDNLRLGFSYSHTTSAGRGGNFFVNYQPSFYAGGVFSSTLVRGDARRSIEILSTLHAQTIFEICSYIMKHDSPDGYTKRFVHGLDLIDTLQKAKKTPLQKSTRPPIGLNPERIVDKCQQCQAWLLGNRYGVKDCQRCNQ